MKRFFALCTVLLSTYALAEHKKMTYAGHGEYVHTSGKSGKYNVMVNGTKTDKGMKLLATFSEGDQSWVINLSLVNKDHDFYYIFKGEKKIGSGYCFKGPVPMNKTCHHKYKYDDFQVELTVHKTPLKAYAMGSVARVET